MNFQLYSRPYSSQNFRKTSRPSLYNTPTLQSSRPLVSLNEEQLFGNEIHLKSQTLFKSETQAEDLSKLPDNSQYQIQLFFPERPKTSHLSGLTLKENERTIAQNLSITQSKSYRDLGLKEAYSKISLPSDQDFTKILAKLEMVSSNRSGTNKRIMLNDLDSVEIILEPGELQYFTINSKDQKPPLVVSIKRNKGKIVSFVSRTHSEPVRGMCDGIFKIDNFQINDISVKFKNDAIYLGIEAHTEAIFTISVSFGKNLFKRMSTLKFTQEEQEIINKPEFEKTPATVHKKIMAKSSSNKDFIRMNIEDQKKMLTPNTNFLKNTPWKIRHEQVVFRKKSNINQKKEKTIQQINRHMIKMEIEKKERLAREASRLMQHRQKGWFSILHFMFSVTSIKKKVETNRKETLFRIKQSVAASKIQKTYRRKMVMKPMQMNLLRTSNLLKLYLSCNYIFPCVQLVKCFRESAKNHKMPFKFANVHYQAMFIQKKFREYSIRQKIKMENLIKLWNRAIEEIMLKSAINANKKKHSKDSGNNNKKYSSITIAARNLILSQYVKQCKKKYLKLVREYMENNQRLAENVISRFVLAQKRKSWLFSKDIPIYTIIPSREELLSMIEKALKISV